MTRAPRLLITASVPVTLQTFLLPYAAHYRAQGWRVDAAANGAPDSPDLAVAFDAVHHLPWTRRPHHPVNLTRAPKALTRLVQRERYDLVHAHDPIAGFVTRYALRTLRRNGAPRVVYTAHGFHFWEDGTPLGNLLFSSLERQAARWTDRLIVINDDDERATRDWPVDVVRMHGIGIDLHRYAPHRVDPRQVTALREELGVAPHAPLFTIVAELNPGKRHRDALEALAHCGREDAILALAGVGPEERPLRALANDLGIAHRIRWLGWRNDVPTLLQASTALLLPSEREGMPRCIMEAFALERPVIASDIRGSRELVQPSTGILTPLADVGALARAMRRLIDDPEQARRMGRAGRHALAPYALPRILQAHDRLYADVLGDPSLLEPRPANARTASARPAMLQDAMP